MQRSAASSGWWAYDPSGIFVTAMRSPLRIRSWQRAHCVARGALYGRVVLTGWPMR